MRHFYYYLQWLFRDFDPWNSIVLLGLIFNLGGILAALFHDDFWQPILNGIGLGCVFVFLGKMVYDLESMRYQRFKDEQAQVFDTLTKK